VLIEQVCETDAVTGIFVVALLAASAGHIPGNDNKATITEWRKTDLFNMAWLLSTIWMIVASIHIHICALSHILAITH
jgi:hypothetical protein